MPQLNLTDRALKLKNVNIPHAKNCTWPIEKKIEAVTTHLALGNLRHVAAVTGVSLGLIKQWRIQPWWKEVEAEIVASRRIQSANKLSKIVDKSLDVIDDRLENGDFLYNSKSGELLRKPVTLRDATTAANALMQRAAIIEKLNKDEQVVEATQTIQEQLVSLAAEFAKMNKRDNSRATTVEFKEQDEAAGGNDDAVYEERETRLQEGGEGVYEPSGSNQEAFGTEQGETFDGESWEGPQGGRESSGSHQAAL